MYTTNIIEGVHRQMRKVTRSKGAFSSENALLKLLYPASMRIIEKWTMPMPNWALAFSQLYLKFEERPRPHLRDWVHPQWRLASIGGERTSHSSMNTPGDRKLNTCPLFIITPLTGITAINNLEVTSLSATEIQLTWTSGNDETATFTIERATDDQFTENVEAFENITAGAESFTDSSLTAGTVYYYRIRIEKL